MDQFWPTSSVHRAVYLCLCQCHAVSITVALQCSLKSAHVVPSALSSFLKIVLAIWISLCFRTNFRIICSSSVKFAIGILTETSMNPQIALDSTTLVRLVHEHGISFHLFVLSSVSLISFPDTDLTFPQLDLFLDICF